MTYDNPDFVEELDSVIREQLALYENAMDEIEARFAAIAKMDAVLSAALSLFAILNENRHEATSLHKSLSNRARSVRWAMRSSEDGVSEQDANPMTDYVSTVRDAVREPLQRESEAHDVTHRSPDRPTKGRLAEVYDVLEGAGRPMTAREIAKALVGSGTMEGVNNPENAVGAYLSRGTSSGHFWRTSRGYYAVSDRLLPESYSP